MRFGTAIKKAIELVLVFALVSAAGSSPAWATWVVQTSGTTNILRGVHFPVDATTGYAVGDSATLLKTTDGGANWVAQTSGTTNPLRDVHFPVDAITGYAVGGSGTLMKTTDGGANWVAQTSGTANNLHDVHFPVDAITGYAVGNSGTLLKTTNGGANWVAQTSGTTNILRGVHFPVDATTGYAVGNSGTLLKTTDGGANWVAQTSGTAKNLLGVHFPVDATTGYAVGNSGTLLKTTDGGANWVAQTSGTAKSLNGVCFPVDASSGYVVGGSGIILTTTDGGANWVAQTSGTANNLHDVHFPVDANTGYAVGGNGTILLGFYIAIDGDFSEWDDGIGNEFCIVDQCGADDWTNPDRLDITKMCIASNQQDTIYNLLAVDDVTLSGQIITSCMLIDTDDPSNGFADFVQCMTLEGSGPTTVQRVELFTCNDTATDGCPGASSIKTYTPSDWGFSNTETGPFGNADSFLELEFPYSDLNISGGQVLFSSYISFPGRAFLTSPKDSIFCDGEEQDYDARIDYDLDNGTSTTVPVTLAYFRSEGSGNVTFEWATATETGNLGFHLYVLAEDGLRRLNKKLIPSRIGDALTPQRYSLDAWGVAGDLFVLEDVDLYGQTRHHGPFELGQTYGRKVWDVSYTDWAGIRREHDRKSVARRPRPALARGSSLGRSSRPARAAAVQLRLREDGIYRVTYEALLAAGVDLGGVPVAHLALLESGRSVPIRVEGRGPFGPGSFIEFVGRGLDTLYTDTNVYTLIRSPKRAARVVRPKLRMPPSMETPAFYYETRTVEANRAYDFAAPGDDPWYDTRLLAISEPVEAVYELELDDRLPGAGPVELTVAMWGVTDFPQRPDHHVVIEVNGVELADEWFDGLEDHPVHVEIPDWILEPQNNVIRVLLPHDTGAEYDLVNYDHYRVRYPRSFAAVDGRLRFTAAGRAFRVDGLPSADVVVYRVTGDSVESVESVKISGPPGRYSATFPGSDKSATYYVSAVEALQVPQATRAPRRKFVMAGEAEMLIISHPDFLDGLAPLVAARRSEGLSVEVVNVEELYARITHGVFDPQAIRTFIRRAHRKLGTEYVLLVGGDTYDYFDYLGQGAISFVPTLYTRTDPIVHYAPVDPLYGDVDSDSVPDVAIGRWPVRTTAELAAVIEKTLEYGSIDYTGTAVLAADAYDMTAGHSFAADSEEMLGMLPPDWQVTRAYLEDFELSEARQVLIDQINEGVALTSYFGHSGPSVWSFHGLFSSADAAALNNAGRPTTVTQWGCWNTYYVSPTYDTLGHRLLLNPNGGAAAVLGASTLTGAAAERKLGRRVFQRLGVPGKTLGRAMTEAKRDLASTEPDLLDVLLGWTLLGDPTLVVQP